MKYFKTQGVYKASNVKFDPEGMVATSYDWWLFVRRVKGKVVFNTYFYSRSTCKHQQKVRSLMDQLNIKIDLFVECPRGLQDLGDAIGYYESEIKALNEEIQKPRSHFKKNEERLNHIRNCQENIKLITDLME